jgi:hypothetical protein
MVFFTMPPLEHDTNDSPHIIVCGGRMRGIAIRDAEGILAVKDKDTST